MSDKYVEMLRSRRSAPPRYIHDMHNAEGFLMAQVVFHPYVPKIGRMKHDQDPSLSFALLSNHLRMSLTPDEVRTMEEWLKARAEGLALEFAARFAEVMEQPLVINDAEEVENE